MWSRPALVSAAILAAGIACGCELEHLPTPDEATSGSSPCQYNFIGDSSLDPEVEVTARDVDGAAQRVDEGGTVPLILPPQGGRVIFVGVRATNMNACGARITGFLRDPATNKIVIDARTVNLKPTLDGRAGSIDTDISTFANIPICPNQWSTADAFGAEYQLEVSVKDRDGRVAKKALHVTLACAEPENEAQCKCICKQGYVLGETCDPDGGTSP
jgi:hypothetical protein